MKISDVLSPALTLCDLPGASKKRVLEDLSALITKQLGGDAEQTDQLFHNLIARERLGSTGIGEGVAIPHCRASGFRRIYGCLIKLEKSIDFDAQDDRPVDLIFALVVPEEKNDEHLATLARIAALMQDKNARESLRQCSSDEELYAAATALERVT